ncbi:MAG: DNA mismatch repair endonuclease MutL [Bacteroidetes bacterium]|nr:MAG: DNA mismatch repair endonuclease MutL [Bacteroidota bacterium]REK34272.1 MAG: DNA mismatch repair endonuclease MutL [Bacteroidota bacterium]REK50602.1 MAG: DNA mismatch repair endonuclease MutL [Bacteroidota bacterium]
MPDIIKLLSDSVANQIAAGEVIQRPASALKELMENSVDSGSDKIEVHIKDSGKTLIQVIDNGCGMSESDARKSFERHATSKIRSADELFSIRTKGFRGEALASIAAVAQVELRTRLHDQETGVLIHIEGSEVKKQEIIACPPGTNISVRNLFFNVPARRNFLKSNNVEARHIIDEFERIAIAHPEVSFSLEQNGMELFNLLPGNLRQRIVGVYGNNYNEKLVPVSEQTSLIGISGFIAKPEFARKSRGEQFFFVNRRYIRDAYLNHAVQNAFEELLPSDSYASYWLHIEIDPARIDVNIHPTKTEIKFEDERSVYAIVRAAVKRALGQYSISPSLDFDRESTFDIPHSMRHQVPQAPGVTVKQDYNPFSKEKSNNAFASSGWNKMYDDLISAPSQGSGVTQLNVAGQGTLINAEQEEDGKLLQIHNQFIMQIVSNGIMLIDQEAAHERVLYEKYLTRISHSQSVTQQELFPLSIDFSSSDIALLNEISEPLRKAGFDIREFGGNSIVLHGVPSEVPKGSEKDSLESILESYKSGDLSGVKDMKEKLARVIARNLSIKRGRSLSTHEMKSLVSSLFACEKAGMGINGKPCFTLLKTDEIRARFQSK